jgi:hypothetical protein
MTEQFPNHVQRNAATGRKAGVTVSKIVKAHVLQPGVRSSFDPSAAQVFKRLNVALPCHATPRSDVSANSGQRL